MTRKTRTGIVRPTNGSLTTWTEARTIARERNARNGRGHRALKAQDKNYAVIFRPAVAANKQRRVRSLPVA